MVGEIVKKASFSTNGYFEEINEVENEHGYQKFLNFISCTHEQFCSIDGNVLKLYHNQ